MLLLQLLLESEGESQNINYILYINMTNPAYLDVPFNMIVSGKQRSGKTTYVIQFIKDSIKHNNPFTHPNGKVLWIMNEATGIEQKVSELQDDLVQDMIDMLTSFCARLYGRRSAKNRALKAVEAIQHEN